MGFQAGPQKKMVSEINVTPLVDVMLVLLVIFMITAPMLSEGVEVNLPYAADAETIDVDEDLLILTLQKDGTVLLGDTALPPDRIKEILQHNQRLKREKTLYLHADQDLPYRSIVQIMASVQAAGAETINLVTDPVDTSEGQPQASSKQ